MIERLPYKVSWSSKKTHCVRNTKFARICLASEIKPGNPQVEKSNMMITWRRGRKVSKVTRASGPPLLFVDCTCEQVAWALSSRDDSHPHRDDYDGRPHVFLTSFFTSPSVGFWPRARRTSPTWVTCKMWGWEFASSSSLAHNQGTMHQGI